MLQLLLYWSVWRLSQAALRFHKQVPGANAAPGLERSDWMVLAAVLSGTFQINPAGKDQNIRTSFYFRITKLKVSFLISEQINKTFQSLTYLFIFICLNSRLKKSELWYELLIGLLSERKHWSEPDRCYFNLIWSRFLLNNISGEFIDLQFDRYCKTIM